MSDTQATRVYYSSHSGAETGGPASPSGYSANNTTTALPPRPPRGYSANNTTITAASRSDPHTPPPPPPLHPNIQLHMAAHAGDYGRMRELLDGVADVGGGVAGDGDGDEGKGDGTTMAAVAAAAAIAFIQRTSGRLQKSEARRLQGKKDLAALIAARNGTLSDGGAVATSIVDDTAGDDEDDDDPFLSRGGGGGDGGDDGDMPAAPSPYSLLPPPPLLGVATGRSMIDVNYKDFDEHTPLHIASMFGDKAMAMMATTTTGGGDDGRTGDGSALHTAHHNPTCGYNAPGAHSPIVALLLRKGADINAVDELGQTPLHYAARYCQLGAAATLLRDGGFAPLGGGGGGQRGGGESSSSPPHHHRRVRTAYADAGAPDKSNHITPLHFAAMHGNEGMVKLLLSFAIVPPLSPPSPPNATSTTATTATTTSTSAVDHHLGTLSDAAAAADFIESYAARRVAAVKRYIAWLEEGEGDTRRRRGDDDGDIIPIIRSVWGLSNTDGPSSSATTAASPSSSSPHHPLHLHHNFSFVDINAITRYGGDTPLHDAANNRHVGVMRLLVAFSGEFLKKEAEGLMQKMEADASVSDASSDPSPPPPPPLLLDTSIRTRTHYHRTPLEIVGSSWGSEYDGISASEREEVMKLLTLSS